MQITEHGTIHIEKYYGSLAGMLKRFDEGARQNAFAGKTLEEFKKWRISSKALLAHLLGLDRLGVTIDEKSGDVIYEKMRTAPEYETVEKISPEKGIIREKVIIRTDDKDYMPVYILIPEDKIMGVSLALPGHQGGGKYSVAGCYDIPAVKEKIDFFNYDYGMKLARYGYVAVCPDCRGFGERRDEKLWGDDVSSFMTGSCRNLANMALPMGLTVVGLCVWDYLRLIDYLYVRDEWDLSNLGCVGFSGGGMQTLYLSVFEKRIKKAFISGYLYGFKDSLMILNGNCACNYIPGLWEHFDMGDILSLYAPKPLFIQSCDEDHLNGPRGLLNVYEQMDILKSAYKLYNREDALTHDIRNGGHRFHDEPLEEFVNLACDEDTYLRKRRDPRNNAHNSIF